MDRFAAMVLLVIALVTLVLMIMAFFSVAPIICSCILSLMYSVYLFMAYEESSFHHAQEFENRFWTFAGFFLSAALIFGSDSPVAFGRYWSPTLGFVCVAFSGYATHVWDRHRHRIAISQQTNLRRGSLAYTSLSTLNKLGIKVEDQLTRINECLRDIDQLLIPSTINNFINERFVLSKEREIITIFEDCDARALNYLVNHVKLALIFYKIKDHRKFTGKHRTEIIRLLAVERLPILTVTSRVIVLHSLQLLKLKANPAAEQWVRNIIISTKQDDLSIMKTLMDNKGDYFCMTKLIYDDLKSETVRQDILDHIRHQATIQLAHMQMGTKRTKFRQQIAWRKVLSDVDDTLVSSGGSYPAGVDKRYGKKVVYPGVLAFYRELDLGTEGPEEWPEGRVGNLVFLSARPHVYKDMSEKANFAKFEKLRATGDDGRTGMHTVPSLLAGDIKSGSKYIVSNDFEHLAVKKFENFQRYVSIYPEYKHVFVADNGQGDVRAGDMMYSNFPYEFEACYVHLVIERTKTHGYNPDAFRKNEFNPFFFTTYPDAAIHAATVAYPPMISLKGMRRVCLEATNDFQSIPDSKWATLRTKAERRMELNQSIWRANFILEAEGLEPVSLMEAEELWTSGQKVRTPYGVGTVVRFNSKKNLYEVDLDWRPLNVQVAQHLSQERHEKILPRISKATTNDDNSSKVTLETVVEIDEVEDEAYLLEQRHPRADDGDNLITTLPPAAGGKSSKEDLNKVLVSLPNESKGGATDVTGIETFTNDAGTVHCKHTQVITTKAKVDANYGYLQARAWVAGHLITPYTPPVLPKLDKSRGGSLFTFWAPSSIAPSKKSQFQLGARCTTPFGDATVAEHRPKQEIVVVTMDGWHARAYLREEDVKVAARGLIRSLFRTLSGAESAPTTPKPKEFPHAEGTTINTPYGPGAVTKPLPIPKSFLDDGSISSQTASSNMQANPPTIALSLTAWTLANGKQPVLYCTVDSARSWKDKKDDGKGIISATVNLVSKTLLSPFRSHNNTVKQKKEEVQPKEEQYFQDAAKVTTLFGNGIVKAFRPSDGFYCVSLCTWTLSDGSNPFAYLKRAEIKTRVVPSCPEGYPVYTNLGLTGILASVQPKTGVHVVTIPSAGLVCYLQPEDVVQPVKAAVGEDVLTAYGDGVIERYRKDDDMYLIVLKGWHVAKLYAKAETFDRVVDGMQDQGSFGMKWLLDMFFSSDTSRGGTMTRSRSNSVTSIRSRATS